MNSSNNQNLSVFKTAKDSGKRINKIEIEEIIVEEKSGTKTIHVKKEKTRQSILGFGGAFTEASASIYDKLDHEGKREILEAYFSENGNAYTMGRTHINSCDFSLGNYALCETKNDIELNNFSLYRDKKMLIPFIKDAINESNLPIYIMASPWSPPPWMKTNGQMNHGGKLKKEYRQSWAEYYCKYIQNYEQEGIPIWGLSVQNEPEAIQIWDSCIYTGEEERDFIKYFLGPTLKKNNLLNKKLIIWDHNRDIMLKRSRQILSDPEAAKYVWGTGFHWYNGNHFDEVEKVHNEFPDKALLFTEGCQEGGPHVGSWDLGERYATSIINDLNRWTVGWIDWNLILDERGGPNHVGNYCSAPIIVDTQSQQIIYQSSYYYLGHFSRFLKRGDKIIECENHTDDLLALSGIDDSGKVKTIVMNKENSRKHFLYENGDNNISLSVPPRSIITLLDG